MRQARRSMKCWARGGSARSDGSGVAREALGAGIRLWHRTEWPDGQEALAGGRLRSMLSTRSLLGRVESSFADSRDGQQGVGAESKDARRAGVERARVLAAADASRLAAGAMVGTGLEERTRTPTQ